ncbi:hypothetical protein QUB16_06745 [Microcoleus sp. D3_18a_C4]
MTKYEISDYQSFEWNTDASWSIPLPEYSVNGYVVNRYFVPAEAPVIPTGWIYEFFDGSIRAECQISRTQW